MSLKPVVFSFALLFQLAALGENWPCFRGPSHQGKSTETNLPLHWNAESKVVWKISIPGEAWSSPIVWGNEVFVTTAIEAGTKCHVLCIDKSTGKTKWDKEVFEQVPRKKEGKNSYATPTPCTDGKSIFCVFGDGSIVALDFSGNVIWTYREFKFYSQHGLGASPILYKDVLIMPYDHSSTGEVKRLGWQIPWDQSFLLGLDKQSGKLRWKTKRGLSRIAHVTPNILRYDGKDLLISGAGDVIQAYDPMTGEQLWSIRSQGEGVVPSIVVGDGLVYSVSGFEKPTIRAVKAGLKGAVTEKNIVWEQTKGVPSVPSLAYKNPYVFAITSEGMATCMQEDSGEIVWQERIGGNYCASPVVAENHIYFLSEEALTTIIDAGPEFKILARNPLQEKCQASMALSDGKLFIRTEKHLWCVGNQN